MAGLWAGLPRPILAQSPAGEPGHQSRPEATPQKPPEGTPQKPAEEDARKRPDDTAPKRTLVSILGREVTNREGDAGRVIDVLVAADGGSGALVVEFGGFMGIGSRKVAVDGRALRFVHAGDRTALIVDISRQQIRDAAEYKPNEPLSVLTSQ